MELTGGDRTTHDVGVYRWVNSIAVVGALGKLNCRTSGKYCWCNYFVPVIV